jgi:Protein involved in formate dehydrogenase formation
MLERRRPLTASLTPYGDVLERWALAAPAVTAPAWSAADCRQCWQHGLPLAAHRPPPIAAVDVEDLLGGAMEQLASLDPVRASGLQRFAAAWDAGAITPASLLPRPEGIGDGAAEAASGLDAAALAWLACATLRPTLEAWFAASHAHLESSDWGRGVCPFCGAPPGFIDVIEGGHRRLACHLCGGGWGFAKLRCPLCGADGTEPLYRLKAEGADEGYVVSGCRRCHGYLKELDRRERWNGGPPLLEDWATPHLDVVARREGYRKPIPSLLDLLAAPR